MNDSVQRDEAPSVENVNAATVSKQICTSINAQDSINLAAKLKH